MIQALASENNPLLKQVRRAVARGTLTDDGYAVAESFHLLEEALSANCEIKAILAAESMQETIAARVRGFKRAEVIPVRDAVFARLSSTEATQGAIALVRPPAWTLDRVLHGNSLLLALDGVQDPGNAGAILRSAEAFGATGAIFLKGSVNPYNPKCLRASAGSIFRLPIAVSVDDGLLLAALDQKRIAIYAATPRAKTPLWDADWKRPCAIVIGNEGSGVRAALQDRASGLKIPTTGVESLNAAVAAGVLLYEARRQRSLA
ncbi:MAG: TrmH family RNA methyltransferase [Bryobacteraceae bacterium]